MHIRRARLHDATAIAVVVVTSWRVAYAGLLPKSYLDRLDVGRRSHGWSAELAKQDWPNRGIMVAENDNTVGGFASYGPARETETGTRSGADTGEILAFYLLPSWWGRGTGSLLMGECLSEMALSYTEAMLWVVEGNVRARRFYAAHGFAPDGASQRNEMDGVAHTELRYRRSLP